MRTRVGFPCSARVCAAEAVIPLAPPVIIKTSFLLRFAFNF